MAGGSSLRLYMYAKGLLGKDGSRSEGVEYCLSYERNG